MTTIAFFGCGNMGAPMVRNLLKAGYVVRVFDLNHALSAALASDGAFVAASAAQAVQGAHTVITMLPHDAAVMSVYLDEKTGLLTQLFKGSLIIDCSTVSPQCARTISAAAHEHQLAMIDAPVSGGVAGAEAGTLSFLCGGSVDDVERARPFLAVMGKNTLHAGGAGAHADPEVRRRQCGRDVHGQHLHFDRFNQILRRGEAGGDADEGPDHHRDQRCQEADRELYANRFTFADIVIDGIPGVFYVLDTQGRYVRWNHLVEVLTGLDADTLLGREALFTVAEQDRARAPDGTSHGGGLRRMSQDHRSDRPRAGEFRHHRRPPYCRERRSDRCERRDRRCEIHRRHRLG